MKYKKPFIIIGILYGILIPFTLYSILNPDPNEGDITLLIPGGTSSDISLLFLVIIPLGAIIGSFLGNFLAPLFLLVHKKVLGRRFNYSIEERSSPDKFKGIFQGLFPALMAINFGLLMANNSSMIELLLSPQQLGSSGAAIQILVMLLLMGWTLGISFALFSSVWTLMEAGIVYNNKDKVKDSGYPVEVRAVGGWYSYLLKGYAGISVILALYQLSSELILEATAVGNITLILTLVFFPILISILVLPAMILFDMFKKNRKNYIRKFARKIKITNFIELDIREIQP